MYRLLLRSTAMSPFDRTAPRGVKRWQELKTDIYLATGITRNGKRFKLSSHTWFQISCINIWRGSYWLVRDNHRWLIRRVYNG